MVPSELLCARRQELEPRGHVAAPEMPQGLVARVGVQGAHGISGAALCQETGVGATRHVEVPELPRGLVTGA
jgi:hypothetical protein